MQRTLHFRRTLREAATTGRPTRLPKREREQPAERGGTDREPCDVVADDAAVRGLQHAQGERGRGDPGQPAPVGPEQADQRSAPSVVAIP